MQSITEEYSVLFNAITDTLKTLNVLEEKLIFTQQLAEELYIEKHEYPDENSGNIIDLDLHM